MPRPLYRRPLFDALVARLAEPPRRLQVLAGPRQVGKTTLIGQLLAERPAGSYLEVAADNPSHSADGGLISGASDAPTGTWLEQTWSKAEHKLAAWEADEHRAQGRPFLFVLDEIQYVPQWSSVVKGLWDAAQARGLRMHVVLLGSAPLLMQKGLTESLAGRYELLQMKHWSFEEMNDAFEFTLDQFIYFGGYPGSAPYATDEARWRAYVLHSLVEPNIQKDVLAMSRVDTPALLRQLFELGCAYSGQILSLDKVSGRLGKGHTGTLANHLTLLSQAGLLGGLQKYAAQTVRQRASPPKFQVHNNALMTVGSTYRFAEAQADRGHWGRLVESAVGAHLINTADADTRIHYWRERDLEIDFVIEHRGRLAAIEVKSGVVAAHHAGAAEFCRRHPGAKQWIVGSDELPVGEFLRYDAAHWVR